MGVTSTASEVFGISGPDLAQEQAADPQSGPSPIATTRQTNAPPSNPLKALLDPQGSAIFWIALAAILGLFMIHGQASVDTKLGFGGSAGGKRRSF
jgi:hypothetical protein